MRCAVTVAKFAEGVPRDITVYTSVYHAQVSHVDRICLLTYHYNQLFSMVPVCMCVCR